MKKVTAYLKGILCKGLGNNLVKALQGLCIQTFGLQILLTFVIRLSLVLRSREGACLMGGLSPAFIWAEKLGFSSCMDNVLNNFI